MKIDVARQSLSSALLLSTFLAGVLLSRAYFAPMPAEERLPEDVALGALAVRILSGVEWLSLPVFAGLMLYNAMRLTRIAAGNMLHVTRTFLPVTFFVLCSCGVYAATANVNGMLAAFCFIVASHYLISSFRRLPGFDTLLRGGIMMGLMPLFYPPSVLLWAVLPAALLIFRRSWREGIACFAGLLLPLALYSYIRWLAGGEFLAAGAELWAYLTNGYRYPSLEMGAGQIATASLIALTLLLSLATYAATSRQMRTRPARILAYFICALAALAASFALPCRNVMIFPLLAVAAAMIMPVYFVRNRGVVPAALYIAMILCAVAVSIMDFVNHN